MSEIVFLRAWPRDPATGAEVAVRLAGGGSYSSYVLGGEHYRAGIANRPRFTARLAFDENGWSGGTVPNVTAIGFAPSDAALRDQLLGYDWSEARIEIDGGPEEAALPRLLTGNVAAVSWSEGLFSITVADLSLLYARPALSPAFAGTGGDEGYAGAAGRARRRSWGVVRNVEGRLFDAANNIYEFGDPARSLNSITALRDRGRDAGSLIIIAWQGSVAATLAALVASAPPAGGGAIAPSIACAKWWTQPAGPLTADLQGENAGGYVSTVPAIADRLVQLAGGPAIANLAAAIGWRSDTAGLHIDSQTETWAAALDRLTLGASLLWQVAAAGGVTLQQWSFSAPAATLNGQFISRDRSLPPTKSRTLTYRANNRIHTDGEISAAVLVGDVVGLSDWATINDPLVTTAKLAAIEAGADVTANRQVTVAPPAAITIYCDSTGAVKPDQLPKTLTPIVTRGGVDIRTDNSVSFAISAPATLNASVNSTNGSTDKGRISIGTNWSGPGTIQLTVTVSGTAYGPFAIAVSRVNDAPPTSSGSTGAVKQRSDSTFLTTTSTSFAPISDDLQVDVAAGEAIHVTAPLDYSIGARPTDVGAALLAKAQYKSVSTGSWVDFPASPVTGSVAAWYADEQSGDGGSIVLAQVQGGLAAGSYLVRLVAALSTATNSPRIIVNNGTMNVSVS